MERSRLRAGTLYFVQDVSQYFYTPDGIGGTWYDNYHEVRDDGHDLGYVTSIATLEDY